MRILFLAWRYLLFHRAKTALLVTAIALTISLPLALKVLLSGYLDSLTRRARETPLIVGARGSHIELALHVLELRTTPPTSFRWLEFRKLQDSELAEVIPLYTAYTASKFRIVGTTPEYYALRKLRLQEGTLPMRLGECVLGAKVAQSLGLKTGNTIVSDTANLFDLAGNSPLEMQIVGILKTADEPEDLTILTDIKTTWVIAGIGHGHENIEPATDPEKLLCVDGRHLAVDASVRPYTRITKENIGSFHFHGDRDLFPVSAMVVVPRDLKSQTILRGRYLDEKETIQLLIPEEVIRKLTHLLFRLKAFMDANFTLLAAGTSMLIVLIVTLSIGLRKDELSTLNKLGCARYTITCMIASELLFVMLLSAAVSGLAVAVCSFFSEDLVRFFLR